MENLKIRKKTFSISKAVKAGDAQNWIPFYCEICGGKLRASAKDFRCIKPCPSCKETITYPDPSFGVCQLIAEYMIDGWISYGNMGEVYMAHDTRTKRKVALKLHNDQISSPDGTRLFEQECELLNYFRHKNIIQEVGRGEFSGCKYLALDYVDGECLDTILKRTDTLDEELVLSILQQAAEAMKYAWEHFYVMHRDLKPGNLMIDSLGHLTIIDWGMAKRKYNKADEDAFGSPLFIDPVAVQRNSGLDTRSDIYSLGVTAFHLLTGDYPYFDENVDDLIDKVFNEPIPMANSFNPEISQHMSQLIYYMMGKTYETRYQNWDEVLNGIQEVRHSRQNNN